MIIFGKKLKELRQKDGLYQKDLAEEFNVSRVAITNWENGKDEPTLETIVKIADFFNVTTDYLLGREKISTFNYFKYENGNTKLIHKEKK